MGDIIVKFEKESIASVHDIDRQLTQKVIGKAIMLSILRGEKLIELTITLDEKHIK